MDRWACGPQRTDRVTTPPSSGPNSMLSYWYALKGGCRGTDCSAHGTLYLGFGLGLNPRPSRPSVLACLRLSRVRELEILNREDGIPAWSVEISSTSTGWRQSGCISGRPWRPQWVTGVGIGFSGQESFAPSDPGPNWCQSTSAQLSQPHSDAQNTSCSLLSINCLGQLCGEFKGNSVGKVCGVSRLWLWNCVRLGWWEQCGEKMQYIQ